MQKKLPIKFANKLTQNRIESLVDTMIALTEKLYKIGDLKNEARTKLENQISVMDDKINDEIEKIYGITKADKH